MDELVTAIITTYHREFKFIERAIQSVENQTYSNIEIIVIDDNQDGNAFSVELKKELENYPEVRYIKQDGNKGACAARNLGIRNAKGKYVAFLDDDDEWLPEKITRQLGVFQNDKTGSIGLVFCQGYTVFDDEKQRKELYNPLGIKQTPTHEDMLYADYIGSTSQPLILKEVILKAGMFDESFPARQDYEMWIRMTALSEARGIEEPLFLYHQHAGEQITSSGKRALDGYLKIYQKNKKVYIKNPKLFYSIMDRILVASKSVSKYTWYLIRVKLRIYRIFLGR